MEIKSVLKPEGSVMSGLAVVGLVVAIYSIAGGSLAEVHASDAYHPANEASRKKAAIISFATVSALTLITRDGNVGVLGYGTIIAMDVAHRHASATNPLTGKMQAPVSALYQAADSTTIPSQQGQASHSAADDMAYTYGG